MMSDTSLLDKFTKEIAALEKVANKSKADRTWWSNKAESFKELLAEAKKARKTLGNKVGTLEDEKDNLQGKYDGLLKELKDLKEIAGAAIEDAKEAEKAKKAIATLEKRINEANEKIRQLEAKIATSESEIASLKNRVLSVSEKVAKKKSVADSFRVYVVLTAVNPDLNLNEEIRALTAKILPQMYSINDNELYKMAEPIMAKMPTQDSVRSVVLLHAAWKRWQNG